MFYSSSGVAFLLLNPYHSVRRKEPMCFMYYVWKHLGFDTKYEKINVYESGCVLPL